MNNIISFFFFFGGGEVNDETVDILGGHRKTGLSLGVNSKHSRAFS